MIQEQFLNELDEGALLALPYLFEFWAMDHQLPPEGDWRSWVIMGGRGAGKTRAGSEWVRSVVEGAKPLDKGRCARIALVGETYDQVREVMIFGDSGILACSPPDRRPVWEATRKRLVWPNGAVATVYSAHDPEGLRGPQFDGAWVDEYGCAAIDKGTNQPNKFLDAKSSESKLPHFSTGQRDDLMQFQYLRAMNDYWGRSENNPDSIEYPGKMLDMERAFAWAWDVRPFPFFPNNLGLWSDGQNHARGHWINGRTSGRLLSEVAREICIRSGITGINVNDIHGFVRGYAVNQVADGRTGLQPLMLRYGFDAIERDGQLVLRQRDGQQETQIDPAMFVATSEIEGTLEQVREAEAEIAGRMRLRFVQAEGDFDVVAEEAVLSDEETHAVAASELNMSLTRSEGRQITERWLVEARIARETARFALPPSHLPLGAGDVIELPQEQEEGNARYRIDRVEQAEFQIIDAVRIEPDIYELALLDEELASLRPFVPPAPVTPVFMDLPLLRGDEVPHAPHLAVGARPWPGAVAVYRSQSDSNYTLNRVVTRRSVVGKTRNDLPAAPQGALDRGPAVRVKLTSGGLQSVDMQALLGGANLAAIGDGTPDNWELFQFAEAELVAPDTYELRLRLRGQAGSDALMPASWPAGSRFVLLDGAATQIDLGPNLRGVSQHYRIGPANRPLDDPSYRYFERSFNGNGLRPLSPCHLRANRKTGGFDFSWLRRTRISGDPWDAMDVPLGEENESYLVKVIEDGVVVRQEVVTSPSWSYGDSNRTADGVSGLFEVTVSQISSIYGAGLEARLPVTI